MNREAKLTGLIGRKFPTATRDKHGVGPGWPNFDQRWRRDALIWLPQNRIPTARWGSGSWTVGSPTLVEEQPKLRGMA